MNAAVDEIFFKIEINVQALKVVLIHRQSHMPMFLLISQSLNTKVEVAKSQKLVEVTL